MEEILKGIYGGDRSHPSYRNFKDDLFDEGPICACGAKINETCYSNSCESKETLSNHVVFPTFCALDKLKKSGKINNHWAYMLEVSNFELNKYGYEHLVEGYSKYNEFAKISFEILNQSDVGKRVYAGIEPGNTVAVLYAKPDDKKLKMVTPEYPEFCCVLKLPIHELKEEAEKLLVYHDSLHEKKNLRCFGCGLVTNDLFQCSACKLFKYCSKECQKKSWNKRHLFLCKQSEILLRLACLPRHQNTLSDKYFSFNLTENGNNRIPLPSYVFNSEFLQNSSQERPTKETRCGICKKTNQECYLVNEKGLTKTQCCSNWICNDLHKYEVNSYKKNSCFRNHTNYTICGNHSGYNDHSGSWKSCKKCKTLKSDIMYADRVTNDYNFEKLKLSDQDIKKAKRRCCICGFTSSTLTNFSGSTCGWLTNYEDYFCKKAECSEFGGFKVDDNIAFLTSAQRPDYYKEFQHKISSARLCSPLSDDFIQDADEYAKQGEKQLQRARYSNAVRAFSLAIDTLNNNARVENTEKSVQIKLLKFYARRAQCYMLMAESFGKIRYAKLASDDCNFIGNNIILEKLIKDNLMDSKILTNTIREMSIKASEFIASKEEMEANLEAQRNQQVRQIESRNHNRRRNNNRAINRATNSIEHQSSINTENHAIEEENEELDEETFDVDVCSRLIESKIASNGLTEDDQCPICFIEWSKFIDPSIVTILPCFHACCAPCLLRYQKGCENDEANGQDGNKLKFSCVLCRKKCSKSFIQKVAYSVVSKKLISSLNLFSKKLPFNQQEFEDVVVSLFLNPKIEFDISQVENALFNMVGLFDKSELNENLDHEEKQKFYELARSPVIKLQKEYSKCRNELNSISVAMDDIKWKTKKKELQDIQEKLNEARKNAAADIFERINSFGNMGKIIVEGDEDGWVQVDLHGLHVYEAKEKIEAHVLPVLPALKKMIIITGYGLHGVSGGILKASVKKYFSNLNIKCIESTKNLGALCIYSQCLSQS